MGYGGRATILRVREALESKGVEARIVELDGTARSAFRASESGRPVLVVASGPTGWMKAG